jgi:hypothetical protein
VSKLGDIAASAGLRRIHLMSWRDLDDVEAGGSEVHASTVARLWAEAGIEVQLRTSYAQGHPPVVVRDGYKVVRRAGRYMIFPRAALFELSGRAGPRDGLVEIWNGMPFFSPVWARGPKIVFLHHVHAEMWQMVLPPWPRWATPSSAGWRPSCTGAAASSPCRRRPKRSWSTSSATPARGSRWSRPASTPASRPVASGPPLPSWWLSAGWSR